MAHGALHRAAHLRHGKREIKLPRQDVETVIEVVFATASQTFDGPATFVTPTIAVGNPAQPTDEAQPEPTNKPEDDEEPEQSADPTVISAPATVEPTASSLFTDTPKTSAVNPVNGVTSATAAPSVPATSDGSMSPGGTAGLVIGILLIVGVGLAGVLFLLKKKKREQQKERQPIDDDEKGNPFVEVTPAPAPMAAASIRTARTASTAPRLSLRPVTEFDPALEEKRKSAANALEMASAAPTSRTLLTPNSKPIVTPWERPGAQKQHEENPFSDPTNPFGDAQSNPATPIPASPSASHASHTLVDNSEFATGAAVGAVAAAATGAAAANAAQKPLPYPQDDSSPASKPTSSAPESASQLQPQALENPKRQSSTPAMAEHVPASPGPAPLGPPPMAAIGHGPAPMADNVHRVQLDFKPSMDDELEIRAGQLVRMLHEYDDGWALCIRMDRSQQGVAPRSCLSKMPVKPRDAPPQQRRPPPGQRGPMGPGVPRPLTPNSGRNSPRPMSPANGHQMQQGRSMSPMGPNGRPRAQSNAQSNGHPRSMSPGPYGGGQQPPRPELGGRRRSNSASQANGRRQSPPGPSPMNPNQQPLDRKPVPGQAL